MWYDFFMQKNTLDKGEKLKVLFSTLVDTDQFDALAKCVEIPNRLILIRVLSDKSNNLVQIYFSAKSVSEEYLNEIFKNGRFDWAFKQYAGKSGIYPAFDTQKFVSSGKHFIGNSFQRNIGKEFYPLAKEIQKEYIKKYL